MIKINNGPFGYPSGCNDCASLEKCEFATMPHIRENPGKKKLMLIGQDPTIRDRTKKVEEVLMLNKKGSQLYRFINDIFADNFQIYATNVVKCKLSEKLFDRTEGGYKFLKPYFDKCKKYLMIEIATYKPDFIITLGESAHQLFCELIDKSTPINRKMKTAFDGTFKKIRIRDLETDYSPLLHIKTYRVAITYGDKVKAFNYVIKNY